MIRFIRKGRHRPWWPSWGLLFFRRQFTRHVYFDASCRYNTGSDHTNKLFGIGYFPSHHKESARFGWRWDENLHKVMLSAYCYVNQERVILDICQVDRFRWYELSIKIDKDGYTFMVRGIPFAAQTVRVDAPNAYQWVGYKLGPYFGGEPTAPHDIKIEIKKSL